MDQARPLTALPMALTFLLPPGLLSFILHLEHHLASLISTQGSMVYAILFAIVFAETGLVLTPFLPGDSLLFAAGAFAGRRLAVRQGEARVRRGRRKGGRGGDLLAKASPRRVWRSSCSCGEASCCSRWACFLDARQQKASQVGKAP